MDDPSAIVASGYDAFYGSWGTSPTLLAIWRENVTGDFPQQFAHISFVRLADLQSLRDGLNLSPGTLLVDLACGAGGPGLWTAETSGAQLVGVDLSAAGIEQAAATAATLGMADRATFSRGSFERTGLSTGAADGAMSVDALQYAPDKARAFAEVARILRPGGTLAFVAFELAADRVSGLPVWHDPVPDYRPVLERAGFGVQTYRQLEGWRERVTAAFESVIANREALEAELGEGAAQVLILEASITLEIQPYCGHAFAVARRL